MWTENLELEKLLGSIFGMELSTQDMDGFLKEKIIKKLKYWCNTKLYVIERGIIVNGVLLSTTYFFFLMLGGTKKKHFEYQIFIRQLSLGQLHQQSESKSYVKTML